MHKMCSDERQGLFCHRTRRYGVRANKKKQCYEMFEISVKITKNKVILEISLVLVPANILLSPKNIFLQKSTVKGYLCSDKKGTFGILSG